MTLCLFGLPVSLWYWRASLRAVSTDSLPPEVKKTRLRSPGAIDARRAASSIAGGGAEGQGVEKPSSFAWAAPGRAAPGPARPVFTQDRGARAAGGAVAGA